MICCILLNFCERLVESGTKICLLDVLSAKILLCVVKYVHPLSIYKALVKSALIIFLHVWPSTKCCSDPLRAAFWIYYNTEYKQGRVPLNSLSSAARALRPQISKIKKNRESPICGLRIFYVAESDFTLLDGNGQSYIASYNMIYSCE